MYIHYKQIHKKKDIEATFILFLFNLLQNKASHILNFSFKETESDNICACVRE